MFEPGARRDNENSPANAVPCCPCQPGDRRASVKPMPVSFQPHAAPTGRGLDFMKPPSVEVRKMEKLARAVPVTKVTSSPLPGASSVTLVRVPKALQ